MNAMTLELRWVLICCLFILLIVSFSWVNCAAVYENLVQVCCAELQIVYIRKETRGLKFRCWSNGSSTDSPSRFSCHRPVKRTSPPSSVASSSIALISWTSSPSIFARHFCISAFCSSWKKNLWWNRGGLAEKPEFFKNDKKLYLQILIYVECLTYSLCANKSF